MAMAITSTFAARDGAGYEQQMGRWSRRLAPLFIDFAGVGGAVNCLDVGCGTGNLSFGLARNAELTGVRGIDVCAPYIDHARQCNRDARIAFDVGDACALPYADAAFDHSLSMLALQFVATPEQAVREMVRVTRRGGSVAAATWDVRGGVVAQRMVLDTAAMLDPAGRAFRARACTRPMSRPGNLAQCWRDAGLHDVVQEMRTIRMDFTSFTDFWSPCEGHEGPVAAYVAGLDVQARAALREAVGLAYLDGEDDGPRSYAAVAWVVKGTVA